MKTAPALLASLCLVGLPDFASAQARPQEESPPAPVPIDETGWRRPLSGRNEFPLALLFLDLRPERAETGPAGRWQIDFDFGYSNIITAEELEREELTLDLEYLSSEVTLRRGFSKAFELSVSIPFYVYHGGFFDPFINGFHEAFNLPNFLRGQTPNGLVGYRYRRDEATFFSGEDAFAALGDLAVKVKKRVLERNRLALALRAAVKLPTGSLDRLSGSGAADLGLGVAVDRVGPRFGGFFNFNLYLLGRPEGLPTRDHVSFMAAFDYRFKPRLAIVAQYDQRQPFVESELPLLKQSARQLALGLRFRQSERFAYEWRFVEDLSKISPDFTFGFHLRMAVGRGAPD